MIAAVLAFLVAITPLIDAVKHADHAALRALLAKKVDVNTAAADGTTALHWASHRDDLESAQLLIRAGANVNAANDLGATPLWIACESGSAPMVKALLQAGANPNLALLLGETPLMVASRSGNADVVEQLIRKGAEVNVKAARGQTALMWAVAQQHPDVVKVLLANGANVRERSDVWQQMMAVPPHGVKLYNRVIPQGGDTALLFAARVGDLQIRAAARGRRRRCERCGRLRRERHRARSPLGIRRSGRVPARREAPTPTPRKPGSPRCMPRSCGATSGSRPRCSPRALMRTRRCGRGRRRGARRRTTTSRPSWSARRRTGWRPASASPTSCGCC